MRSLIGVDLNGVNDRLGRLEEDGKEECINLGVRSSMIRLIGQKERWLAGMQNEFAPHGRGPGWGRIGSSDNRVEVLKMLELIRDSEPDERIRHAVTSSLPGLVGDSELAVFAVPDIPAYGEHFRDRYLRLLNLVVGLRPLLLWRPVAALLGHIANAPQQFRASMPRDTGSQIAILSLMADGIHLSLLSLEEDDGGSLLVPQRKKSGQWVCASFRGDILVEDARSRLAQQSFLSVEDIESSAISPWLFAVGEKPQPELVRLTSNRGWMKLPNLDFRPPSPNKMDLPDDFLNTLCEAQALIIEGPFAGNKVWCEDVKAALTGRVPLPEVIETLDISTVALGCLEAARRHRCGQPIYFDFLPQLEINAMVGNAPQFVDLIERGARCRGGEPFVADAAGVYVIDEGATRLTFWLFKEDFERARKADVELPIEADRRRDLSVSVKQTPGQGFAEVQISSPDFAALRRSPIILDWASMEEVDRSRDNILRELEDQSQTGRRWPDTDVKPGHPLLWLDSHPKGDLLEQLAAYRATPFMRNGVINPDASAQLKTIRERFSKSDTPSFIGPKLGLDVEERGNFRALDSNGELPKPTSILQIPERTEQELDETLSKCEEDLAVLQRHFGVGATKVLGHIVGFASWCFWRCPPSIAEVLLGTYEGKYAYSINHILLREGVARVVWERHQIERYFLALESRLARIGRITAAEYAGLARVLGTSDRAAGILGPALADRIRDLTERTIANENEKGIEKVYERRFKAALLMLATLLRHREARNNFLDPATNAVRQLLSELDRAKHRNYQFAKRKNQSASHVKGTERVKWLAAARRFHNNAEIIAELTEYIHFKGRDPNIIRRIDMLDEE